MLAVEGSKVESQKQPNNLTSTPVVTVKPERKPIAVLNKPENTRYVVRLTVSPTNFLGFVLEDCDTHTRDYEGTFGQLFANDLKPGDVIALNRPPRHGLNDLDYIKTNVDEGVANEYPYLEDLPVRHQPATGSFYIDIPAQNRTGAFRYYLSNEIVDKLDQRLGYADFKEGCLVTGFVVSEKHFHITYVKPRPFTSAIQSSK